MRFVMGELLELLGAVVSIEIGASVRNWPCHIDGTAQTGNKSFAAA